MVIHVSREAKSGNLIGGCRDYSFRKLLSLALMTMTMAVALRVPMLPSAGDRRRHCSIGMVPGRRSVVMAEALAGRTSIHRLIESEGTVLLPGCYDALSAAIVQMSGFSAGFISGYALSASLLGKPDFGLLTSLSARSLVRCCCCF